MSRRFGLPARLTKALHGRLQDWLGIYVCGVWRRPLHRWTPWWPELPAGYVHRLYRRGDADELLDAAARRPELGLTPRFVNDALRKGDVCGAVLHRDEVVSFTWVSTEPTRVDATLHVECAGGDSYSYFHYTLPQYRGLHLPRLSTPYADADALARGCTHSVSYIAVDNPASQRAARALGARCVGYAAHFRWYGRIVTLHTPGTRRHGFRFRATEAPPAGRRPVPQGGR